MAKRPMTAGRMARAGLRLVAIFFGMLVGAILSGALAPVGIRWSDIDDKEGDSDETNA